MFCGDHDLLSSHNASTFKECSRQKVIIYTHDTIHDTPIIELIEKARFSFLPLNLASKYRMIRLIDSRISYELLQRSYDIPSKKSVSKSHEQVRTLENIVEMDKAGMIISPEIVLHENVAFLDYDNEYANLIINHSIGYETLSNNYIRESESHRGSSYDEHNALLPSIIKEIVIPRVCLKQLLKKELEPDSPLYSYYQIRLEILKQNISMSLHLAQYGINTVTQLFLIFSSGAFIAICTNNRKRLYT